MAAVSDIPLQRRCPAGWQRLQKLPLTFQDFRLTAQLGGRAPLEISPSTVRGAVAFQGRCGSPRSAPALQRQLAEEATNRNFPITTRGCPRDFDLHTRSLEGLSQLLNSFAWSPVQLRKFDEMGLADTANMAGPTIQLIVPHKPPKHGLRPTLPPVVKCSTPFCSGTTKVFGPIIGCMVVPLSFTCTVLHQRSLNRPPQLVQSHRLLVQAE